MSSSNEIPRLPADDRPESYQPTVATLAADCAEYAESDEEFRVGRRVLTAVDSSWQTKGGIWWHVGFNAIHNYEDGAYSGDAYLLELSVRSSANQMSAELRNMASECEFPLPVDKNIRSIIVTYAASYVVSQYATLGWSSHREYNIAHDQEGIVGPGCELNTDSNDSDEQEDDHYATEEPPKYMINIRRIIDQQDPPEVSPEWEVGGSCAGGEDELIAGLDVELYLRCAREILNIVQNGKDNNFDLYTILPPEAMEMIDQF